MPAVYQLLPRPEDYQVTMNGQPLNYLSVDPWIQHEWGLADPRQARALQQALPQFSEEERRAIARDHLAKCLNNARQLHASLDLVAPVPAGTEIYLFAGDAKKTLSGLHFRSGCRRPIAIKTAGDGVVSRASALAEQKSADGKRYRRINFNSETFIKSGHVALTRDPIFVDNVLNCLLGPN